MNNMDKYNERDWEEIASYLSGESSDKSEVVQSFITNRGHEIENYWKMIDDSRGDNKVNVDKAWEVLFSRLNDDKLVANDEVRKPVWGQLLRVAALIIVLAATTLTLRFFLSEDKGVNLTAVATTVSEKNKLVHLPDGSSITLNRNSELTFPDKFDSDIRKVELRGEAFFDIKSDPSRPFIVDAGRAQVKVLGTSFNVITNNSNSETEVFVASGKVLLCNSEGDCDLTLEPGYIGTLNGSNPIRRANDNPNYMSWNTDILTYDGDRLEQVLIDLKRTHDIIVEVETDSILDKRITTVFKNNSPEVIIESICTTFSLTFENKEGIYYLSK